MAKFLTPTIHFNSEFVWSESFLHPVVVTTCLHREVINVHTWPSMSKAIAFINTEHNFLLERGCSPFTYYINPAPSC